MEDERMTKAVVLGWMEALEKWGKKPGRTRKTVLYWRKLLKEAEIEYTQIGRLTEDRKAWRGIVGERMRHLNDYERSKDLDLDLDLDKFSLRKTFLRKVL